MWANAAKRPIEAWYEMYVKPWHPELAMVEMRVLSQVISASSCERKRSAHGHIHSKLRNRLEPATTEKLVYVYSNSKMVAATRDANELKMLAWAVHLMKSTAAMRPHVILRHTALRTGHSPGEARVAESPSRRVAHFSRVAESWVAAPRLGAPRPTLGAWTCLYLAAPAHSRRLHAT